MSAKNKLQEYLQQNKLSLPSYTSKSAGLPHQLKWASAITISDLNIELETDNQFNSKVEAEQAVALSALNIIKKKTNPYTKSNSSGSVSDSSKSHSNIFNISDIKNIILIDLENKPVFTQSAILNPHNLYIGFHNSVHHSLPKYSDWHRCHTDNISTELESAQSNLLLYLIEGGVLDLVDHFMTAFCYPLVTYIKTNKLIAMIYILSGDHAGFCTKACLEKTFEWMQMDKLPIRNIGSITDII